MSKGKDYYRKKIIEDSPVQLFTATNTAMLEYPYVVGHPNEKSPTLSSQANMYVMDSGIGDSAFDNDDVIEAAESVNADVVVPKDVLHDTRETTAAVVDMAARVDNTDMTMWVPTQSDGRLTRVQHYQEIADELSDMGLSIRDYRVAVGGIRDETIEDQILECVTLNSRTPEQQEIHAFGCGFHSDWVAALRHQPSLVDSIDTSSVARYVNNGSSIDGRMNASEHVMPRGTNSTVLSVMERERILYMFNHLVSDNVHSEDAIEEFESGTLSKHFST